jgi:hypothetical protein
MDLADPGCNRRLIPLQPFHHDLVRRIRHLLEDNMSRTAYHVQLSPQQDTLQFYRRCRINRPISISP